MISVDGYKHALKMLEILDMNLDDFLFEKYLNIALDYENQSGFFCSNYRLVTFGESPFFTLDYDDKGRIKGRCAVRSKT